MKASRVKKDENTEPSLAVSILLNLLLDLMSTVDLISDFYVIKVFVYSRHTMWMCVSMSTIMIPFFVAQVPYLNFKLNSYQNVFMSNQTNYGKKFLAVLLLTPFLLIYFLITDCFYLVVSILLAPVMFAISIFNPKSSIILRINDVLETLFYTLFGLQKINMEGFRRLRSSC